MGDLRSYLRGTFDASLWLARYGRRFRKFTRNSHGLQIVRPLQISRWHRGSKYFRAIGASGGELFLKVGGDYELLPNEVAAWQALNAAGVGANRFAQVRAFDLAGRFSFVGFEWIHGLGLREFLVRRPTEGAVKFFAREMIAILDALARAKLVHRDLTPENLLVRHNMDGNPQELVLIDFAFAVGTSLNSLGARVPISEQTALCYGYKPAALIWDDGYAYAQILEQVGHWTKVEVAPWQEQARARIGALVYKGDSATLSGVGLDGMETNNARIH
jgi:serine/threonine protein kinase